MHDSIIKAVKTFAEENPDIEILWLYGSRAKGQQHVNSDYDFAVAYKNPQVSDPVEKRLRPEILAIDWQAKLGLPDQKLSIVDINQAEILLAMEIVAPCCVLVCKNNFRLAQEENRISSMFEEKFPPKLP